MVSRLETRLWERSMALLQKDRKKATPALRETILRAASPYPDEGIYFQIDKDLKVYPLFEALALWTEVNPDALENYHPELRSVVSKLVNAAEAGFDVNI